MRIDVEYPFTPRPRYGFTQPPHPDLQALLERNRHLYERQLKSFLGFRAQLIRIPNVELPADSIQPTWNNGFFTGLDAAALYGLIASTRPGRYFEIGSGNSTKFARRAIADHRLQTEVISLDPSPRVEVDLICDRRIPIPIEDANPSLFEELEDGDLLFLDGSHCCFMNTDVTVFFLEVLPRLAAGIRIHLHDIFLPYDYPEHFIDRHYSEQYVLAAHLLAGGGRTEVLLPNAFVAQDKKLSSILAPLWASRELRGVNPGGCSFWMRTH